MKVKMLLAVVFLVLTIASAQDQNREKYVKFLQQGFEEFKNREYDKAIESFKKAVEANPRDPLPYYDIACAYSIKNDVQNALIWFEKSIDLGYADLDNINRDKDLDNIRRTKRFKKIIHEAEAFKPKKCPELELPGIYGGKVNIKQFSGKVVLLYFWGTWCPSCRKEIPHLNDLYMEYRDRGLIVVGISDEGSSRIRKFAKKNGVEFLMLRRPRKKKLDKPFTEIRRIPAAFLIDCDGFIISTYIGYRGKDCLENAISELLPQDQCLKIPDGYVHRDATLPEIHEMALTAAGILQKLHSDYELLKIHKAGTRSTSGTDYFLVMEFASAKGNTLWQVIMHRDRYGECGLTEIKQIE